MCGVQAPSLGASDVPMLALIKIIGKSQVLLFRLKHMISTPPVRQRIYEMLINRQYWLPEQMLGFQRGQLTHMLRHAKGPCHLPRSSIQKDPATNQRDLPSKKRAKLAPFSRRHAQLSVISGIAKFEAANASCNIQTRLTLNTDRLQVDSLFETTNQDIGSQANTHRGLS
jgi:hypothetical protein